MAHSKLSSPTSFISDYTYDVFLSFRGSDTRKGFTSDLNNSLRQKGIRTFIDKDIKIGEEIMSALGQAIRKSRMFIVVFSQDFASSTHCLNELVMIRECLEERKEGLLFPVFYDVQPSQVRHQTGTYAEALVKHEERFQNKEMDLKWKEALSKAADMHGRHFEHGSQSECEFVREIVKEVSKRTNRSLLHVADNPVGLEYPVLEVTSLLGLGSEERVTMVGIYGVGGIGKSSIARAVYNLVAFQFEGHCFLADIRERSNNHDLAQHQQTLLAKILEDEDIKVRNVYEGIQMIKDKLQTKKVLLIIDDVDKLKQLKMLARHDWFGSGSKVIITTRDKHLLDTHGVIKSYEVRQLNDEQALELFSWNAFRSKEIDPSYADVSKRAISYLCGLPLALEVIGSDLFGKDLHEWTSILDKYKKAPHKEIHEILKISYDNLHENEKGIFLDIACFFDSYKICYVKEMLNLHGFYAENGIRVLTDKSLIKIDGNDRVRMHDLIQDMGREIVRQESTSEPGRRSRLWFNEDIVHVLEQNTGTDAIEVIVLDLSKDKEVQWSGNAFVQMKNLRILIIKNGHFSRGPENLPNSLRVLRWSGYPSPSLPSNFNPKNLVKLSLPESFLQSFKSFESLKVFESLSLLNFEGCKFLSELPSLSGVSNLAALYLNNCTSLTGIHSSVGLLNKLKLLRAKGCTQLETLVPSIYLTSLETLDLTGCSSLNRFPEVLGKMENIKEVYLDHTNIDELPSSIGNFVGLQHLFLRECQRLNQLPSSIHKLAELEIVTAYGCGCRGFTATLYKLLCDKRRSDSSSSKVSEQFNSNRKKAKITPLGP